MYRFHNKVMQGKERLLKLLEENDPNTVSAAFDSFPMYPEDVERLENIIRNNTHMVVLRLLDCTLSVEQTASLSKAILENDLLLEVKIEGFKGDPPALKTLLEQVTEHVQANCAKKEKPGFS